MTTEEAGASHCAYYLFYVVLSKFDASIQVEWTKLRDGQNWVSKEEKSFIYLQCSSTPFFWPHMLKKQKKHLFVWLIIKYFLHIKTTKPKSQYKCNRKYTNLVANIIDKYWLLNSALALNT